MSAIAGPFFAATALLGSAGIAKVVRPRSTAQALRTAGLPGTPLLGRVLGLVEIAIAVAALGWGSRLAAALVALSYLAFALFTFRLWHRGDDADCGCFGAESAPATPIHVAMNVTAMVAAAMAVGWPTGSLVSVVRSQPWAGLPFLALTAVLAWLAYVTLTLLPALQRSRNPR